MAMVLKSLTDMLRSPDRREVMDALIDIGKEGHPELAPELFPFLTHPDPDYRSLAIQSLGLFLRHPDARDIALRMWALEPDPDAEVQEVALGAWAGYYRGTADRRAMQLLVSHIRDRALPKSIRRRAYSGLLRVSGAPRDRIAKAAPSIDDELVKEIAREHRLD